MTNKAELLPAAAAEKVPEFWVGDVLNRRETTQKLESYLLNRYQGKKQEEGFVLAINADWGLGKTFMLTNWKKELEYKKFPSVYFDAWKNDFTSDPLIAFISEMDKSLEEFFSISAKTKSVSSDLKDKAKAILIPALKVAGYAALKHGAGIGVTHLKEMIDLDTEDVSVTEGVDDNESRGSSLNDAQKNIQKVVEATLKEHKNKNNAIKSFKCKLGFLIDSLEKEACIQLPLFIFIDELDRCRPDYAIELLEGIKHLFGVKGIYFVVATNISQLAESVKAIYGSGFNGEQYLKRFFDLEYTLPEPSHFEFAKSILANINGRRVLHENCQIDFSRQDISRDERFDFVFSEYAKAFNLSLRDQHQVARVLDAAISSLTQEGRIYIHFLLYATMLYHKSSQLFSVVFKRMSEPTPEELISIKPDFSSSQFEYYSATRSSWTYLSIQEIVSIYFAFYKFPDYKVFKSNFHSEFSGHTNIAAYFYDNLQNQAEVKNSIKMHIEAIKFAGGFSGS